MNLLSIPKQISLKWLEICIRLENCIYAFIYRLIGDDTAVYRADEPQRCPCVSLPSGVQHLLKAILNSVHKLRLTTAGYFRTTVVLCVVKLIPEL